MERLDDISNKLNIIIKIMATNLINNKSFDEKIICLSNLGLDNNFIAEITGAKGNTIKTRKSQLKNIKK